MKIDDDNTDEKGIALPPVSSEAEFKHREKEEDDIFSNIERIKNEFGAEACNYRLFRINSEGKQAHLRSIDADNCNFEYIGSEFGGGRYVLRVYGAGRIRTNINFVIDDSVKSKHQINGIGSQSGSDAVALIKTAKDLFPATPDNSNDTLMMMMQMQKEANDTNMKMMMAMMSSFAQVMGARPVQQESTLEKLLPVILPPLLNKMMSGGGSDINSTIEAIERLQGMSARLAAGKPLDEEPEEPSIFDNIIKAIPSLATSFLQAGMANQQIKQVQPVQPSPALQQAVQAQPPTTPQSPADVLYEVAAKNTPVDQAYEMIITPLPDDQYSLIVSAMEGDNWFDMIVMQGQKLAEHKPWFEKFRNFILEKAKDVEEPEVPEPAETKPSKNGTDKKTKSVNDVKGKNASTNN